MLGSELDDIEINPFTRGIKEEAQPKEKHTVFTFGRFNPPHAGHEKLINKVKDVAAQHGADHMIFTSHSHDRSKNPLPHDEKVGFMKKIFPNTNIHDSSEHPIKTALDAVKHLSRTGTTHATFVVGQDRVDEFHNLLHKYNKHPSDPDFDPNKHYHIPHLNVISAGQRDPDAEDVTGASASKQREHAQNNNFKGFHGNMPAGTSHEDSRALFHAVRHHMGIHEAFVHYAPATTKVKSGLSPEAEQRTKDFAAKAKADIQAARREDQHGRRTAKPVKYDVKPTKTPVAPKYMPASMAQNPYEERQFIIRYKRDNMAPGKKAFDIGCDKDLNDKDVDNQLPRRQGIKRFKTFVEDGYDPGSSITMQGSQQDLGPNVPTVRKLKGPVSLMLNRSNGKPEKVGNA